MRFPVILFDADDTLFDFSRSEKHSFSTILATHGIEASDPIFNRYKEISLGLWKKFEQGRISKEELRVGRYRMLIEEHGLNADAHALSEGYLEVLKEQTFLINGAVELCKELASTSKIGIVTNGIAEVQKHRFSKSLLAPYIDFIVVSEECGYAKPHKGIFEYAIGRSPHKEPSEILMVGDRLDTDIVGAQAMGMKTCWFNPTKIPNTLNIQPDFEVDTLAKILKVRGM